MSGIAEPGSAGRRASVFALVAAICTLSLIAAVLWSRGGMPSGNDERCLACHANVSGLGEFHRPEVIGCATCHLGDGTSRDPARAHAGMVRVPGNLADAGRTCGRSGCHEAIVSRVEQSIMATMAGVIAVNRRVLGEAVDASAAPPHANQLGTTPADSHLRELCVSCHLGQPKTDWGPIDQQSRGGGCNACHLVYDAKARATITGSIAPQPDERRPLPTVHPALTVNPTNEHCFGCHSRSSRIATSYEGWHEIRGAPAPGRDPGRVRQLDDGRYFERVSPDIHHERGLDCIDCHTATELMGSGAAVAHKGEQVRIACEDCHASKLASVPATSIDPESAMLLALRRWSVAPEQRFGTTRGHDVLTNVFVDDDGRGRLRRKRTGEFLALKPPLPMCMEGKGHRRLSCASCHSAWAPRCTTCHTQFDPADEGFDHVAQKWVPGTWNESSGPFEAAPPTLGIRVQRDAEGKERGVVETFVPGMIMTFDRNRASAAPADVVFRRLYGRIQAHTIRREVRSCVSCHSDPVALGYGRGTLRYDNSGGAGRWRFEPREKTLPYDGLPADAWIGFLGERAGMLSTRDDVRPFTVDEQRRILRVGACLACHAGDSTVMRRSVADFESALARRSPRCVLPESPWSGSPLRH